MIILAEITAKIQCPNYDGYFLRWYFNGWHSFYFSAGDEQLTTSGKWHNTESITKARIGAAGLTESEIRAIRTMLFANRVEVLLQDGWKNVVIDSTTLKIYNSNVNGFRCEFGITIYAKVADYTPVIPPVIVTENVRITPEADIRITPENDTRVVNSGDYDPIVSYTPFPNITKFVGENIPLPNTASVVYASGKTANLIVTWDYFDNSQAGTFDVYGDVGGGELAVKQCVILTAQDDLYWLRQIRDANPTSQLPSLWLDSEDPYTQWEGIQWSQTTPKKVEVLTIGSLSINSLNGVNNLKSLIRIICPANNMTSLDLSDMPNLGYINCGVNNISIFSISNSPNIYQLQAWNNKILNIDLSLIIDKLKVLELDHNLLTAIPSLTYNNNLYTYYDFRYNNMSTLETSRIIGLNFDNAKVLPQNP